MNIRQGIPYVKGQVWYVREPEAITEARIGCGSNVMAKSRPYLVFISEKDARLKFNVIQAFPISSNCRDNVGKRSFYDFDIRFVNPINNEINRVITGQLTTIDTRWMEKYLFTLPSDLMLQIDRLVVRRFGITPEAFECKCEDIPPLKEPVKVAFPTIKESNNVENSKDENSFEDSLENKGDSSDRIKQKHRVWTKELCEQYLEDFAKIKDRTKLAEKWGYSTASIYNIHRYCKDFLKQIKL